MLLDDVIAEYDVGSSQEIHVAAPPERVYQVLRTADLGQPRLIRFLMGLRAIPARLAAPARHAPDAATGPQIRRLNRLSVTVVAEDPGRELVLGLVGRFWTLGGGVCAAAPGEFFRPPPPGLAQGMWNFRVTPDGSGTRLSTETRVRCGDAASRRKFLRYWRLIRVGSGLTRWSMLRFIRRVAERQPA